MNEGRGPDAAEEVYSQESRYFRIATVAVAGVLVLSMAVRLSRYLFNGPLRLDEALLAVNVMEKTYGELLGPLEWHQNSPFAFLYALKLFTDVFGQSEMAFRFLPLMAGLGAMILFCALVLRVTQPLTSGADKTGDRTRERWVVVVVAIMLFATGRWPIYWSSEVRHYTTDVAFTCVLYLLALSAMKSLEKENRAWISFGPLLLVGTFATWISLASIFILGGIGATFLWIYALRRRWHDVAWVMLLCVVWLVSFYGQLHIHDQNIAARGLEADIEATLGRWGYTPNPPESFLNFKWYRAALELMFDLPGGLAYTGVGMFAFAVGCIAWWPGRKEYLSLFLFPILLGIIAAYLHRYPFWERYLLYLIPIMYILIAQGVGKFFALQSWQPRLVGLCLVAMLLVQPSYRSLRDMIRPYGENDFTHLISHVENNWAEGDILYLDWFEHVPFIYYREKIAFAGDAYELEPHFCEAVTNNEAHRAAYRSTRLAELLETQGRIWVLHGHDGAPVFMRDVGRFEELRELERLDSTGVELYLIDSATD